MKKEQYEVLYKRWLKRNKNKSFWTKELAEEFIKEAIDSILAQSYQNFELIIVNDASTDQSLKVIKRFSDPRIKLIKQKKQN